MTQCGKFRAVDDCARPGIDRDEGGGGVETTGVRPIVLVRSQVPLDITLGPAPHAVRDLLKISPDLIAGPGATRMLGQIISLVGIPAVGSKHRAGRATVS